MIKFTNYTINTFKLSISDNRKVASGTTAYWYMELTNDMTKVKKFVNCAPLGGHTARFITLRINEPVALDLVEQGFYTYKVYETSNAALDISNYESTLTDSDIVHKGKLFYDDTANTEVSYTQYTPTNNTNTTNNNTIYLTI